ncbi:MAG TPA: Rho termination factor N-terminal domain-containing protein, partial [Mycobacterium sp.]
MTETDLVTADDSTENHKLSNSVTTDSSADRDASGSATEANTSGSDGSLSTMVLPELRALANRAGVKGTSGMRKNELIAAIRESREGRANGAPANGGESHNHTSEASANHTETIADEATSGDRAERRNQDEKADQSADKPARDRGQQDTKSEDRESDKGSDKDSDKSGDRQGSGGQQNRGGSNQQDDDGDGRGGRRGRRFRERRRRGDRPGDGGGGDTELRDDDVVQPVAGILDVLDNYAFVRTSGYLAGPHDVYVSMNMVRKNGLRRGDAVTGAVRV